MTLAALAVASVGVALIVGTRVFSAPGSIAERATATRPAERLGVPVPPATPVPPVATVPGSQSLNCAPSPSGCGYPDASNTGPAAGTAFRAVPSQVRSGPGWEWSDSLDGVRVTSAGAVLDGLNISGTVLIDVPNVTLSNSKVSACGGSWDGDVVAIRYRSSDPSYRGSGARIVHNELNGTPSGCNHRGRSGVRDIYGEAPNAYVDGNNIYGTGNGITVEYSGTIVNNWIHDLGHLPGDHHSGISSHGGAAGLVIQHNTVLLYGQSFPGGGGVSGAITVYADFGHAQNVTVRDNLISGGSYVVYGGESGDGYRTPATNIKFISNRFRCGDWLYGPVAAFDPTSSGNVWTGNFCDQNGTTVKS